MRPKKKAERSIEELARRLQEFGMDSETVENIKNNVPDDRDAISRQGEAVLLWLESPAKFTMKICKRKSCSEPFGTNYRSVAYCSDNCRAKEISSQIGIKWDWLKQEEERWGGEPPLIIPPHALRMLLQYVGWFVDNLPTHPPTENPPEKVGQFQDQVNSLSKYMDDLDDFLEHGL